MGVLADVSTVCCRVTAVPIAKGALPRRLLAKFETEVPAEDASVERMNLLLKGQSTSPTVYLAAGPASVVQSGTHHGERMANPWDVYTVTTWLGIFGMYVAQSKELVFGRVSGI